MAYITANYTEGLKKPVGSKKKVSMKMNFTENQLIEFENRYSMYINITYLIPITY
jgi:hypothetical protein